MNREKVAILTSVHYLFDTRIFHKQAKTLLNNGYDVYLVAQFEQERKIIDGIKIIPLKKPRNRLERLLKTNIQLCYKALKLNADYYHFHDPELIFVGLILRLKGKKVIYDIHENVSKQILTKDWVPFRKGVSKLYRFLELMFCRYFNLVLAEKSYEKYYPEKYNKFVIQNFPDLKLFPNQSKEKKNEIVYIGGVAKERAIETILRAIHLLKKDGINLRFNCIGPYNESYYKELNQLCDELGIKSQVKFYGRLNAVEAYDIALQAKVGLALLYPIPNYIESYPTKVFEYMALKLPFITSDFPLYKELIKETKSGLTVNPYDAQSLKEAIKKLIEDPEYSQELAKNGREFVEKKYNWEVESAKLLSLYKSMK